MVYRDSKYAKAVKLSIKRFIILESYFLKQINYNLFIAPDDFKVYCDFLFN